MNIMNDNTKPSVMSAIQRIKEAAEAKKDDIEVLCEDGLALMSKVLWINWIISQEIARNWMSIIIISYYVN